MAKSFFFACCENCSSVEWIENIKIPGSKETIERINELTEEGEMKFPWKADINTYVKFSETKINEKQFRERKQRFANEYEDIICLHCEKRLNPIPFSEVDKEQRIHVFNMNYHDRILFAKSYKIVKIIEKEN